MNLRSALIVGWSFVWGATLFGLSNLSVRDASPIAMMVFQQKKEGLLLLLTPIYSLCIWTIGCAMVWGALWIVDKRHGH